MTDQFKPFNPNDYMNQFPAPQPQAPAAQPVATQNNPPYVAAQPVQYSNPPSYPQTSPVPQSPARGYGGGNFNPFGKCHFTGKLQRKPDKRTGQMTEEVECSITQAGWAFLQQNPPGTVKMSFRVSQEFDRVRQTGQGYCEGYKEGQNRGDTVVFGYFRLNSKGWNMKNGGGQQQYPQQGGQQY